MIFLTAACEWLFLYLAIGLLLSLSFAFDLVSFNMSKMSPEVRMLSKAEIDAISGLVWPAVLMSVLRGRGKVRFGKERP